MPPFLAFLALVGLARHAKTSTRLRWVLRGVAAGLATVSFASLGLVGMIVSTLPEIIQRPLPQIAWPFLRAGRVPHHALEIIGVTGAWPWHVALVAASGALGLVLVAAWNEHPPRLEEGGGRGRLVPLGIAAATALVGIALLCRVPAEAKAQEPAVQRLFARAWEPADRANGADQK